MKLSGAINVQSGAIQPIEASPSSRILLVRNAVQQSLQNLWPQERDKLSVCDSSKQIWQTNGSGSGVTEAFALPADSAATERRVVRLVVVDEGGLLRELEMRPEEEEAIGGGGASETPDFTFSTLGLSMYFSIRRSLFQFMCRKSSDATSCYRLCCMRSALTTRKMV